MKNIRLISSLFLVFTLILTLAACTQTEQSAQPAQTQARELVIGIPGAVASLDVNQEAGIFNYYIATLVNEGLIAINNEGRPVPGLAESWETDDYSVWTFNIRRDARFSDGSPVTVEDIIWSIERAIDPELSPGVAIYFPEAITAVEQIDEFILQITLSESLPNFIWAISNVGGLFVTQREWGESSSVIGSPQDLLLGSGPFRITAFNPGSSVTLEANDYWWGESPTIENIRFDFIADDTARLMAFAQGSVDFMLNIPVEQVDQWQNVEGATVQFFADRSYYGLTIDPTVEPFGNEHVRRAVAYSMDAAGVVNSILSGHATVATAITPPEQFASVLDINEARARLGQISHHSFNMERAREEFALSGAQPFETSVSFPSSFPNVGRASLVLADALRELGITLSVREIPLEQWLGEIGSGEEGISWMIYFATTAEPAEIAAWLLDGSGPGYNPGNFTDLEIAGLIHNVMSSSAENGIDDLIRAHDLAQARGFYIPVWWGESAIAFGEQITVNNFNSFTLLSENWVSNFTFR